MNLSSVPFINYTIKNVKHLVYLMEKVLTAKDSKINIRIIIIHAKQNEVI